MTLNPKHLIQIQCLNPAIGVCTYVKLAALSPKTTLENTLTDCYGSQVELLCIVVLIHVVVIQGGKVSHRQRHFIVLLTQELLLDLNCFDVHFFSFLFVK